jgi:hypothetical protein
MKTSNVKDETLVKSTTLNSAQENINKEEPGAGNKTASSTVKAKRPNYRRLL